MGQRTVVREQRVSEEGGSTHKAEGGHAISITSYFQKMGGRGTTFPKFIFRSKTPQIRGQGDYFYKIQFQIKSTIDSGPGGTRGGQGRLGGTRRTRGTGGDREDQGGLLLQNSVLDQKHHSLGAMGTVGGQGGLGGLGGLGGTRGDQEDQEDWGGGLGRTRGTTFTKFIFRSKAPQTRGYGDQGDYFSKIQFEFKNTIDSVGIGIGPGISMAASTSLAR